MKTKTFRRRGFTLIELLIVIGIIGILAGLVSSAIVKVTRTAANKRNANNARRLLAAVTEYWHDKGRWPIEDNPPLKVQKKVKEWQDPNTGEKKKDVQISYCRTYCADNNEVVKRLLNVEVSDGTTKDFLDLHGFQTPVKQDGTWPCAEVADAFLVYNGEAVDEDGKKIPKRADPVLAYFTKIVSCPDCGQLVISQTGATCKNMVRKGSGEDEETCGHVFTKKDLEASFSGAMPFVIEMDVNNNVMLVRTEPGEAAKLIATSAQSH